MGNNSKGIVDVVELRGVELSISLLSPGLRQMGRLLALARAKVPVPMLGGP